MIACGNRNHVEHIDPVTNRKIQAHHDTVADVKLCYAHYDEPLPTVEDRDIEDYLIEQQFLAGRPAFAPYI